MLQTARPCPGAARPVRGEWARLAAPGVDQSGFDPSTVADLPEPARRWLVHAIAPGTPLWHSVTLTMRGEIRIGAWRSFTATQVIAPSEGIHLGCHGSDLRPAAHGFRPPDRRHGRDEMAPIRPGSADHG